MQLSKLFRPKLSPCIDRVPNVRAQVSRTNYHLVLTCGPDMIAAS
uniref:Uncharacterized protein n=1 Tax=Arundo donax TaxID=35708 RepID=A0A0A9BNW2_ARUDO